MCLHFSKRYARHLCGVAVWVGVFDGCVLVVLLFLLAGSIVTNVFGWLLDLLGRSVDDDDNDYDVMLMVGIVGRVVCYQVGRVS